MAPIPGSVRVTGFIAPSDSTDTYAAQDEMYNRGGWRTVADITARNAITPDRRKDGMIVRVRDAGGGVEKFYQLKGGLADINWLEQSFGGGGTAYYPKYLVGAGVTYPFNTIQAAIIQAIADGKGTAATPALVLVDAGVYAENLALHEHIHIIGLAGDGPEWPVEIRGSASYSPVAPAALDNQLNISGVKLSQPAVDTPALTVTGAAASALVYLHNCGVYKTFGVTPNIRVNATSATQVAVTLQDCKVHRLWALAGKAIEFTAAVVATTTILSLLETDVGDLEGAEFPGIAIDLPRGNIVVADRCAIEGNILLGAGITAGVLRDNCTFTHNGAAVMNVAAGAVNVELVSCTIDTDTGPTVTGAGIFKYAFIQFKNVRGFAPTLNAGVGALPIVIDDASNIRYSNVVSGLVATDVQAAIDELVAMASGLYLVNRLPVETPNGTLDTFTLPGGDQYVPTTLLVMLNGAAYQPSSINEIGPGYTQFQIVGGDTIPKAVDAFTLSYNKA